MWVTAFDESAKAFLKNATMESLFPMTNKELCEYAESIFCYEQFRVQVTSKMDQSGKIQHIINGKPTRVNVVEAVQSNLNRIMALGR
jgi:hypothetical protein